MTIFGLPGPDTRRCRIGFTIPYAPCTLPASYRCVSCDSCVCDRHTILHRQTNPDCYDVGTVCLACSNQAEDTLTILHCKVPGRTYHINPDRFQLAPLVQTVSLLPRRYNTGE